MKDHNLKVNMNEYLPLRDVVFNTLRQAILKGELEPGERLMEIQLADRLGVSRQAVSKWESGASEPSTSNLLALCKLFDVSPEEFLGEVQ